MTDDPTSLLYYNPGDVTPEMIGDTGASNMSAGLGTYGITYQGSTVVFLSETSIRHYYKGTLGDVTVTFNGAPVTPVKKGSEFYFELTNIAAANIDKLYTLQIVDAAYDYSVLAYTKACLASSNTGQDMKALAAATYLYNQAANAYFEGLVQ